MSVVARQAAGEDDYARMRRMLIAATGQGDERHYCTIGDLDWWRFTSDDPEVPGHPSGWVAARLWLDGDEAVGVAWPDGTTVNLLVHPAHRAIEDAMLDWAAARHRERSGAAGGTPLAVNAYDGDTGRVARLRGRGYKRTERCFRYRRRPLDGPIAAPELPSGYTIRHVAGEADLAARVAAHRAAFAPSRMTEAKHRAVTAAPTYRAELDLMTVAPDGRVAAYCLAWFDAANRIGVFEPVGADPEFQRRGLGRAVMAEGLRRLRALGARVAYVGTNGDNVAANRLYEAVGFRVVDEEHAWTKTF